MHLYVTFGNLTGRKIFHLCGWKHPWCFQPIPKDSQTRASHSTVHYRGLFARFWGWVARIISVLIVINRIKTDIIRQPHSWKKFHLYGWKCFTALPSITPKNSQSKHFALYCPLPRTVCSILG